MKNKPNFYQKTVVKEAESYAPTVLTELTAIKEILEKVNIDLLNEFLAIGVAYFLYNLPKGHLDNKKG